MSRRPSARRPSPLGLVALALTFASAVALVWVTGIASGGFSTFGTGSGELLGDVAFLGWDFSPVVGLAVVVLVVDRRCPLGRAALLAGTVVFAGFLAFTLADFLASDSSTSALVFVFLPIPLWTLVLLTGGVAVLVQDVRGRRAGAPAALG